MNPVRLPHAPLRRFHLTAGNNIQRSPRPSHRPAVCHLGRSGSATSQSVGFDGPIKNSSLPLRPRYYPPCTQTVVVLVPRPVPTIGSLTEYPPMPITSIPPLASSVAPSSFPPRSALSPSSRSDHRAAAGPSAQGALDAWHPLVRVRSWCSKSSCSRSSAVAKDRSSIPPGFSCRSSGSSKARQQCPGKRWFCRTGP
jgi:hypothetical protein